MQNLAWKLAAVLAGRLGRRCSTYRRAQPLGKAITEQSLSTRSRWVLNCTNESASARPEYLNEQGIIFGASYASSAIVPDGTPPVPVSNPVTDYAPSARPGGRAPHAWLQRNGAQISTIDLLGREFVLLTSAKGAAWSEAARPLGIKAHAVGDQEWAASYGVDGTGAVLVRPDGYVGWRSASMAANPAAALGHAVASILGRADPAPAVTRSSIHARQ